MIDPAGVETNLVFFEVVSEIATAAELSRALSERGVRMYPIAPQRLRACTHLDVTRAQIQVAAEIIRDVVANMRSARSG